MYTASKDETVANLKNNAQNFRANASEAVDEAKDDLRDAANRAGKKVRGVFNTATEELTHARDAVTEHVRTSPVQSSIIALGLGFVIGALFRGR
jgi:ElaB/YqjD/DUF883 family membrane-anchored ribosome-binding protein